MRRIQAKVFASACFIARTEVELDDEEQFAAVVMRDHKVPGGEVGLVTRAGRVPD